MVKKSNFKMVHPSQKHAKRLVSPLLAQKGFVAHVSSKSKKGKKTFLNLLQKRKISSEKAPATSA